MSLSIWRRGDVYPEEWPQWLRSADIKWCRVEIEEGGRVIWHDGVWSNGFWCNGTWYDGTWCAGSWCRGLWISGEWRDGEWYDGEEWRDDGPPVIW